MVARDPKTNRIAARLTAASSRHDGKYAYSWCEGAQEGAAEASVGGEASGAGLTSHPLARTPRWRPMSDFWRIFSADCRSGRSRFHAIGMKEDGWAHANTLLKKRLSTYGGGRDEL
jgi:D-serine deaminase-like pyridoxal phosphate-dependent protein